MTFRLSGAEPGRRPPFACRACSSGSPQFFISGKLFLLLIKPFHYKMPLSLKILRFGRSQGSRVRSVPRGEGLSGRRAEPSLYGAHGRPRVTSIRGLGWARAAPQGSLANSGCRLVCTRVPRGPTRVPWVGNRPTPWEGRQASEFVPIPRGSAQVLPASQAHQRPSQGHCSGHRPGVTRRAHQAWPVFLVLPMWDRGLQTPGVGAGGWTKHAVGLRAPEDEVWTQVGQWAGPGGMEGQPSLGDGAGSGGGRGPSRVWVEGILLFYAMTSRWTSLLVGAGPLGAKGHLWGSLWANGIVFWGGHHPPAPRLLSLEAEDLAKSCREPIIPEASRLQIIGKTGFQRGGPAARSAGMSPPQPGLGDSVAGYAHG